MPIEIRVRIASSLDGAGVVRVDAHYDVLRLERQTPHEEHLLHVLADAMKAALEAEGRTALGARIVERRSKG